MPERFMEHGVRETFDRSRCGRRALSRTKGSKVQEMTGEWSSAFREELSNAATSISMARTLLRDYRGQIEAIDRRLALDQTLDGDIHRLLRFEVEIQGVLAMGEFRQLVAALVSDGAFVDPKYYATELDLTPSELAQLAGVPPDTVTTTPESPKLQEFLLESLKVLGAAVDFSGDYERARSWFRTEPIQPLDDKTAEILVSEGKYERVLRYIDSLNAGCA